MDRACCYNQWAHRLHRHDVVITMQKRVFSALRTNHMWISTRSFLVEIALRRNLTLKFLESSAPRWSKASRKRLGMLFVCPESERRENQVYRKPQWARDVSRWRDRRLKAIPKIDLLVPVREAQRDAACQPCMTRDVAFECPCLCPCLDDDDS